MFKKESSTIINGKTSFLRRIFSSFILSIFLIQQTAWMSSAYAQYEDPNTSFESIADNIFGSRSEPGNKISKRSDETEKSAVDNTERIRIKRVLPSEVKDISSTRKRPDSFPKVAPNIVKHKMPAKAPRLTAPEYKPSSATRIARPVMAPAPAPELNSSFKPVSSAAAAEPVESAMAGKASAGLNAVPTKNTIPGLLPPQKPQLASPDDKSQPTTELKKTTSGTAGDTRSGEEKYPAVARLETLTFGTANPSLTIEERLNKLETSIFAKVFEDDSLFDRTERLKRTLLGVQAYESFDNGADYGVTGIEPPIVDNMAVEGDFAYLDGLSKIPENQEAQPPEVLRDFALTMVNFERKKRNLPPLEADELIQKMADEHIVDMLERKALSHSNLDGKNPDRRYTEIGGVHAVVEGLVATSTADLGSSKLTKAVVCVLLKKMLLRQDDREALLSPWATHLGSAFGRLSSGTKIFAVTEVLTKRAEIHPFEKEVELGDKVKVSGRVLEPYKFDRITVAWEEFYSSPIEEDPAADEALPYFPPLDFIAYETKSEKDYSKAITALKALGVMAAIAGGVFVPPVALAAPLIVMAGPGGGDIRPRSDIPVKGGVKLNGTSFKAQVELDNESQEGLYYVTVWASLGDGTTPVAVSRRAILVKKDFDEDDKENGQKDSSQEKVEPIEYTKESDGENEKNIDKNSYQSEESDEADAQTGL